jgi:hypothetical protein
MKEDRTVIGKIQLTRTQPTFDGHRWWFLLPEDRLWHNQTISPRTAAGIS